MDEKQKAREYSVESIANLASCTPSIREGFWDRFTVAEIENIQISFYDKAEKIVVSIEEGVSDPQGFSKHLYSNPLLSKAPPNKMIAAINEMAGFFQDMTERIKRSILYAGSDLTVPENDPIAIDEDTLRKAGVDLNIVKRRALEKREAFLKTMKNMIGDINA